MVATTLNGGINSTVTDLIVTSATGFPKASSNQAFEIILSNGALNETMRVVSTSGTTYAVQRGVKSSTAQAWSNGVTVKLRGVAFAVDEQKLNVLDTPTVSDATITITDITTNDVSITKHGFAPKAPNDSTKYLDGTGVYSTPSGGLTQPQVMARLSIGF